MSSKTTQQLESGVQWLRERLTNGRFGICEDHYHLECKNCGVTKCGGETGYEEYQETDHVCDCKNDVTTHMVVPIDTFGQHVGFPE